MQIYLPVHQAACSEEVFDRVDSFGFYDQMVVFYIEHLDDARRTYVTFRYSGIEAVAAQVVEAVHVQLSAYQLVEETLGVFILEYLDGKCQLPVHFFVDAFHEHQGNVFVRDTFYNSIFKHVRERTVPDVVHEDSRLYGFRFTVENEVSFGGKLLDSFTHKVECPQ